VRKGNLDALELAEELLAGIEADVLKGLGGSLAVHDEREEMLALSYQRLFCVSMCACVPVKHAH
jgi:hypothetical protein